MAVDVPDRTRSARHPDSRLSCAEAVSQVPKLQSFSAGGAGHGLPSLPPSAGVWTSGSRVWNSGSRLGRQSGRNRGRQSGWYRGQVFGTLDRSELPEVQSPDGWMVGALWGPDVRTLKGCDSGSWPVDWTTTATLVGRRWRSMRQQQLASGRVGAFRLSVWTLSIQSCTPRSYRRCQGRSRVGRFGRPVEWAKAGARRVAGKGLGS